MELGGSILKKIFKTMSKKKNILFLRGKYNNEVKINTKTLFLCGLFSMENDFAKYFAKFCDIFIYFVLHITVNL